MSIFLSYIVTKVQSKISQHLTRVSSVWKWHLLWTKLASKGKQSLEKEGLICSYFRNTESQEIAAWLLECLKVLVEYKCFIVSPDMHYIPIFYICRLSIDAKIYFPFKTEFISHQHKKLWVKGINKPKF